MELYNVLKKEQKRVIVVHYCLSVKLKSEAYSHFHERGMCTASSLQNRALIYNKDMTDINSLKNVHAFLLTTSHFISITA